MYFVTYLTAEMFFTLQTLKNKGIISIEEPYLADMIHKTSYDQIYDEYIICSQ